MEHLAEKAKNFSTGAKEVFSVDSSLVGRIIGKKGENISRIRDELEVNIHIPEKSSGDGHGGDRGTSTITITGSSSEAVRKAREQIEYITVRIPIDPDQVGWIVGRGFQNLNEITEKAELMQARYDDRSQSIELCGLRHQVEDAKLMLSVHLDYLNVYQDMSEER